MTGIASTGCGATILDARFSSGSGSPQGIDPGQPDGRSHLGPEHVGPTLNAGVLAFTATNDTTSFFSRTVNQTNTTKTIFWKDSSTPVRVAFHFHVTAYHTVSNTFPTNPCC